MTNSQHYTYGRDKDKEATTHTQICNIQHYTDDKEDIRIPKMEKRRHHNDDTGPLTQILMET